MNSFQIIVGLMLLVAIAIVAMPLLFGGRREIGDREAHNVAIARERLAELKAELAAGNLTQAGFDQAEAELEQSLAADLARESGEASGRGGVALLVFLIVALPAGSIALYAKYGAPEHLDLVGPGVRVAAPAGEEPTPSVDELLARLVQRLETNPDDADGWYLLGRTYMSMQRFGDAVNAYEQLYRVVGEHPAALISLADAIAMTQGGRVSGRPEEFVQKALAASPEDPTANWLAGKAAEELGNYEQAIAYWQMAAKGLAERPQLLAEVNSMIQAAADKAGVEVTLQMPEAATAAIQVRVSLAPALADQVQPDDVLFVFARAEQGPPMPLAVSRLRAADLPAEVRLDDSMAMMPELKLSGFQQVMVSARISKSGQPVAQPGDLESEVQRIQVAAGEPVSLLIDREVP